MRKATFAALVFVVCGYAATAQLTVTPRAGIEQTFSSLKNAQGVKTNLDNILSPQFSVRIDYRFKNIHGPFVGLATSRAVVANEYDKPMSAVQDFTTSRGDLDLRLEAGYMYSSPAIKLGKAKTAAAKPAATPAPVVKKTCGGYTYYSNRCGQYKQAVQQAAAKKIEPMSMRIQPFAGVAMMPDPTNIVSTFVSPPVNAQPAMPDRMSYRSERWSTAFIGGTNFEFARGTQKKFVVGVQYFRTAGHLKDVTAAAVTSTKPTVSDYKTTTAAWNVTLGVPFSFGKKKAAVKQATVLAPAAPAVQAAKPEVKKKACMRVCGKWQ